MLGQGHKANSKVSWWLLAFNEHTSRCDVCNPPPVYVLCRLQVFHMERSSDSLLNLQNNLPLFRCVCV